MAKLTRYSSFQEMKADDEPKKIISTSQSVQQSAFEVLLMQLRESFAQQQKVKNNHGS